jgi:RNA polymerase sigma-70 factor (ECF subfamily)
MDLAIISGNLPPSPADEEIAPLWAPGLADSMVASTASVPASFEQIALPHLDAAYNLARWLMRDRAEAEEVVQEALLRALTYFSSFKGSDGRAWLLQIVRNAAYARMASRRDAVQVSIDDDEDGTVRPELRATGDDPETALARRQDRERLRGLLEQLPVELRECVVLCDLEEFSYKQIAEITEVPIGTVMSRLWRARKALMRMAREEAE